MMPKKYFQKDDLDRAGRGLPTKQEVQKIMTAEQIREASRILETIVRLDLSRERVVNSGFALAAAKLSIEEIKFLLPEIQLTANQWFKSWRDSLLKELKALGVDAEGV